MLSWHFLSRCCSPRLCQPFFSVSPTASLHVVSLLMPCDRSHLLSTPAPHLLSPSIWWRAKMVICYSLLANHRTVKSAFCLQQPWKQLQSACISAAIALHISWQRFADSEIEKQIYFSQSMKETGKSFKSILTQLSRSYINSTLFKKHIIILILLTFNPPCTKLV